MTSHTVLHNDDGKVELLPCFESTVNTRMLEECVECFLKTSCDESAEAKQITTRPDCHLLDCRRPIIPVTSVFGVLEESIESEKEIEDSNPALRLRGYETNLVSLQQASSDQAHGPHSEWTTRLDRPRDRKLQKLDLTEARWFDLRKMGRLPESMEGCCKFLRSLLGTSHDASPWCASTTSGNPLLTVVVGIGGRRLAKFRTGDACPSHYLHSLTFLEAPTVSCDTWWSCPHGPKSDCTLLVYRVLPPREFLFSKHPKSGQVISPVGCLWESYWRQSDDDDEDGELRIAEFFRPVSPPYISHDEFYPGLLHPLMQRLQIIRDEALAIPRWTAWPERQHYSTKSENPDSPTWTVFPLCYCFPANLVENRKWIETTCSFVPNTTSLLRTFLGDRLRTALFSRLESETILEAHIGWEDLANHVFRVHLPLVVPPGDLCGTWVDGCVETHCEGRPLCFDDSKTHRAFNYSRNDRIVLILDLARPAGLPLGTASGGHSDELDKFIDQVS